MTVSWALESDGSVLHLRSGPRFSSEELAEAVRAALDDPAARLPLAVLWDNRGSEESVPQEELRRRVERIADRPDRIAPRVAMVVSDPLHFGLARVGASYAENRGIRVEIFSDLESARAWLTRSTG